MEVLHTRRPYTTRILEANDRTEHVAAWWFCLLARLYIPRLPGHIGHWSDTTYLLLGAHGLVTLVTSHAVLGQVLGATMLVLWLRGVRK